MKRIFTHFFVLFGIFFGLFSSLGWAEEIRDIKPPVDAPANYFWLVLFLAGVFLIIMVYFIKYLVSRFKKKHPEKVIIKLPWEIALEQLETLKKENLSQAGKIKEHYIRLSDIVRRYIENRFDIRAPEMTTQEFLFTLRNSGKLKLSHKELLKDFLNSCDMVKFAKYGPSMSEIENSNDAAKRFIEETAKVPAASEENKQ